MGRSLEPYPVAGDAFFLYSKGNMSGDVQTVPGEKVQKGAPLIVLLEDLFKTDSALQGILQFNETFQTVQFAKGFRWIKAGVELEDKHVEELLMYTSKVLRREIAKGKLETTMSVVSMKKIVNPIKDYLTDLKWDGTTRLGSWLPQYTGCVMNDYTAAVGKIVLTAAVARIFEPGIKYDYMMILEGRTRIGKSRLLKALGGDFYLDMHLEDTNKDIIDNMRGKWIIEISELAGFGKRETDWLKAFLSRGTDRVRLSYGKRSADYPRQSILVGSMNPSGDNLYFKDDTGNARYWPIACGDKLDVDGITVVRDQLFAEAVYNYKAGMPLYLIGHVFEEAEREQDKRLNTDPWQFDIAKMLRAPGVKSLTTSDILDKLGISMAQRDVGDQMRVGKIMKRAGWNRYKGTYGAYYALTAQSEHPEPFQRTTDKT